MSGTWGRWRTRINKATRLYRHERSARNTTPAPQLTPLPPRDPSNDTPSRPLRYTPDIGLQRVPNESAPQTMFVPIRRGGLRGSRWLAATGIAALLAIAGITNLDRIEQTWNRVFPPDAEFSSDEAIPGILFVRSNPNGARVFINGRAAGRTPLAQGYSARGGIMRVRVESRGHQPWERIVALDPQGVRLNILLKRIRDRPTPPMIVAQAVP